MQPKTLQAIGTLIALVACVIGLRAASPLTVEDDPLEGIYSLVSKSYSGSATIRRNGETYVLQTQIGQKGSKGLEIEANKAIGLKKGDVLSFGWSSGNIPGVSVYKIEKDGTLNGHWSLLGGIGKAVPETLKKIGPLPAPLAEEDD